MGDFREEQKGFRFLCSLRTSRQLRARVTSARRRVAEAVSLQHFPLRSHLLIGRGHSPAGEPDKSPQGHSRGHTRPTSPKTLAYKDPGMSPDL